MPRHRLAALLALAAASLAHAQAPKPTHTPTLDDYFSLAAPGELALSPDLQHVAYTDARWQKSSNDRKADLWVLDLATAKSRRLTADRRGPHALRWAPDGRSVFHLAARTRPGDKAPPYNGKAQVWRTTAADGRTTAVTRVPEGIAAYAIDDGAKTLLYAVTVPSKPSGPLAELLALPGRIEYDDGPTHASQLWRLDLKTHRAEKLLDDNRFIRELALHPAGTHLAMITAPDDTVVTFEGQSRVEVLDLATKKTSLIPDKPYRADMPSKYGWLENLAFAPGPTRRVAFNVVFDGYPSEVIVGEARGAGWASWKMKRPDGVHLGGYGAPLAWASNDRLMFPGESKARARLWQYDAGKGESASAELAPVNGPNDDICISALSVADRGDKGARYAVIAGTPARFPEVCLLEAGKPLKPLTDLNPQTAAWKLPRVSVVSWKGADGAAVEGVLDLPHDAKPGQPLPLVVAIHGGPTSSVRYQMQFDIYEGRTFLPSRGYAVLCPNYRGSTGYGDKFLTGLIGRENDVDVKDILAGVDALIARKIADPDRLAVMGWSNGGYLTNCVISTTARFKAASSGAGIVDTAMQWGSNDEPAYMVALKGGTPWQVPDVYRRTSPTYRLDKITTPTLIHVGGNDVRCPPAHSRMLFRALSVYNKVPARLVSYTGEPHGLGRYDSRRAKMTWDLAWFDKFVRGKE